MCSSAMMEDDHDQWTDDAETLVRVSRNPPVNPSKRRNSTAACKRNAMTRLAASNERNHTNLSLGLATVSIRRNTLFIYK